MPQVIPFPAEQELEWRVKQLVAENRGVDVDELERGFSLRTDLGMDGDDALEFFGKFGEEFGVDLSELRAGWPFFFGPEGIFLSLSMKLALAVSVSAGVLEWLLFPHFSSLVAFVTVGGLFVVILVAIEIAGRVNRGGPRPAMQEITIGELIDAARSGEWKVPKEIREWVSKQQLSR